MRIVRTVLAAALIAVLVNGAIPISRPGTAPVVAASCPAWQYRSVSDYYQGGVSFGVWLNYTYRFSYGCAVVVTHVDCTHWGFAVDVSEDFCAAWSPYIDNHYSYVLFRYRTCALWSGLGFCIPGYIEDLVTLWGSHIRLHP